MTTETEFKVSEEPLAERVLRQGRSGTLDESRLLPSAEKRGARRRQEARPTRVAAGLVHLMAGQAYAMATGKAPSSGTQVMAVEQVMRWRRRCCGSRPTGWWSSTTDRGRAEQSGAGAERPSRRRLRRPEPVRRGDSRVGIRLRRDVARRRRPHPAVRLGYGLRPAAYGRRDGQPRYRHQDAPSTAAGRVHGGRPARPQGDDEAARRGRPPSSNRGGRRRGVTATRENRAGGSTTALYR